MLSTKERERILKIHHFLPGRRAKLISTSITRSNGWCQGNTKELVGQSGKVIAIHENVNEAVRVELHPSGDIRYWHHEDLELIMPKDDSDLKPVFFDTSVLDV